MKKIMRTGVYGVAMEKEKMLLIKQSWGPYAGRFDFPGGGVEFGESAEFALRREFVEEVGMEFDSIQLIDNLTATVEATSRSSGEPYAFFQIGMIYQVTGCRLIQEAKGELQHFWIDPKALSEGECSKLLWKWKVMP